MENYTKHKHYQAAHHAYYNTSFTPEKRAESECIFYDEVCAEFAGDSYFLEKFEKLFTASLAAKSRCISSAVTGPANFPVARAEKARNREAAVAGEMLDFIKNYRDKKAKEAYYNANPDAKPIGSDDADALERLRQRIESLKNSHKIMVDCNKILRKKPVDEAALLALLGTPEKVRECLKPDFMGRASFPRSALTNNLAAIKATEKRIVELEERKATTTKDFYIGKVRCFENVEEMRLQLFFDGKPEASMIALLKSKGFKWSPKNQAWQRLLNNNAVYAFNHYILPELKKQGAAANG